jgi:hypothetical protein
VGGPGPEMQCVQQNKHGHQMSHLTMGTTISLLLPTALICNRHVGTTGRVSSHKLQQAFSLKHTGHVPCPAMHFRQHLLDASSLCDCRSQVSSWDCPPQSLTSLLLPVPCMTWHSLTWRRMTWSCCRWFCFMAVFHRVPCYGVHDMPGLRAPSILLLGPVPALAIVTPNTWCQCDAGAS